MAEKTYDVIVIGAGPGGYVAAIRCAQLGLKTLCIDKEYLGGVCLNWGCIPSKALIAASGLLEKIKHAEVMGLMAKDPEIDVAKMQEWKEGIVKKLTSGVGSLIKGNGGEVLMGTAKLVAKDTVEVQKNEGGTETYQGDQGHHRRDRRRGHPDPGARRGRRSRGDRT